MKTALGGGRLGAAVLAFGLIWGGAGWSQEAPPPATSFIKPTPDRQCDEHNRSWKVTNEHTYRSIKVLVRWIAVGAKQMQEEFILTPGGARALGCAAQLEIVAAEIMEF
jgi:hypothetical protein